ncbi:MAG: hypothetical protein LKE27_11650 [Atopobiaceae bacterium]|nr:hypothetical protein [Atopobiaceae bacterium]
MTKGIKDLTRPTLEEILERGTCVCGLKFSEHPEAIAHIKEEMRYCPPESIGTAVRNYRNELGHFRGDQDEILQGMQDRQANIFLTTERIQENDEQIDQPKRAAQGDSRPQQIRVRAGRCQEAASGRAQKARQSRWRGCLQAKRDRALPEDLRRDCFDI